MKKLLTILLLLCCHTIFPLCAGTTNDAAHFPNADLVLIDDVETTTYQADGSAITTDACKYRILTEAGRRRMRQMQFYFSTSYEKISISLLRIVKADGKTVTLDPAAHSNISTESSQMSSRIFDPSQRILSVTIPGLSVGDTICITTRNELFKPRIPGAWSDITVLQADFPVVNYVRIINAPKERPLLATALKDEAPGTVKFTRTEKGGRIIYRWHASNVPQIIREPGMPPIYTCVQRLLTSTVKEWQDISRWYDRLCAPALAAVSQEMRQETAKLIAGKNSDEAKIYALFQFVSQKIRYTGITDESVAPGYEPHKVDRTFARKHGVCRDKAALLTAMLRLAGFKAYPVLFMSGYPKDEEVPNIYFNHAIVAVEKSPGQYQLMDPTFETTTELFPAYLGNCSYLTARAEGDTLRRSPTAPAQDNLLSFSGEATLQEDHSVHGTLTIDCRGIHDQMFRSAISSWSKEQTNEYFASKIRQVIPGAMLESIKITPANIRDMSKELRIIIHYRTSNAVVADHSSPQPLVIPEFSRQLGTVRNLFNAMQLERRIFPLEALPRMVREDFRFNLPPCIKLEALPTGLQSSIPGVMAMERKIYQQNNILYGSNLFSLDCAMITPQTYLKIKDALRQFDAAGKKLPVSSISLSGNDASKTISGADSLVEFERRNIELQAPGSWQETLHIRRKILTYAAAVRYSTVTIPYTVGMTQVQISGFTETPDGQRHELAPAEINHMDADWVSSSRYTGGKIVTAALPGVIPGSTVEYKITLQNKNFPFFHTAFAMRTTEPAILREITIRTDRNRPLRISPQELGCAITYSRERSKNIIRAAAVNSIRVPNESSAAENCGFLPEFKASNGNYRSFGTALLQALEQTVAPETPEITALAARLTRDKNTLPEKLEAIRLYVSRNIRTAGPGLNVLPWQSFSRPAKTLAAGTGNSADIAILYAALLKSCKIDYVFVAASPRPYLNRIVKNLYSYPENIFDSLLVYVPEAGIYLNDSGAFAARGAINHEGRIGLKLPGGLLISLRPAAGYTTAVRRKIKITILPDGDAEIDLVLRYSGNLFERENHRFAILPRPRQQQYFEMLAASISQAARVQSFSTDFSRHPGQVKCRISIPHFASKSGKFLSFELPFFSAFSDAVSVPGSRRTLPYIRKQAHFIENRYEIIPPANYQIQRLRNAKSEYGKAYSSLYREKINTGKTTVLNCTLICPVEIIMPDEFHSLLRLNQILNEPDTRRILLKNKEL